MITVTPVPGTNTIELEIDGEISAERYDQVVAEIESAIEEHGKLRVLKKIGTFHMPPIPWSKFDDDVRFGLHHLGDFTHAAVVADQGWVRAFAKAMNPMLKAEIKAFTLDELEEARRWLREAG